MWDSSVCGVARYVGQLDMWDSSVCGIPGYGMIAESSG